jgi:hypothetical protein
VIYVFCTAKIRIINELCKIPFIFYYLIAQIRFEIICSQDELTCFKTYTVYDMYGKQMLTGSLSGRQQRVNTAQLSSGTYLLTLTGNLQTWSDKVVVR